MKIDSNISHVVSQISSDYQLSQDYSKQRDLFPYLVKLKKKKKKHSSIQTLDQRAHPSFAAHYITPYIRSPLGLKKKKKEEREEALITVLLLTLLAHHKETHLRFPTFHHPFSLNRWTFSVTADTLTRRSPRFAAW